MRSFCNLLFGKKALLSLGRQGFLMLYRLIYRVPTARQKMVEIDEFRQTGNASGTRTNQYNIANGLRHERCAGGARCL